MMALLDNALSSPAPLDGPGRADSQIAPPRQLTEQKSLKPTTRDLDGQVPQSRNLNGLRQRRISLQKRRYLEIRLALLSLFEMFCSGEEVRITAGILHGLAFYLVRRSITVLIPSSSRSLSRS
jgi:hypothetical protein